MELEREENLTSCKARELFSVGKEWIEKLWKEKGKEVLRIEISPKSIGRNPGFIIDVKLSDEESGIRYYAKIQTAQIDTILIHHLLKYTKCGPDEFLIALLTTKVENVIAYSDCNKHGVITREADNCFMTSAWSDPELRKVASLENLFRTESLMFTLFIALGRFGNLPNNRDNWGLRNFEKMLESGKHDSDSCLMIIDFSSGGCERALHSHSNFLNGWTGTIAKMFNVYHDYDTLSSKQCIVEAAKVVPWLRSKEVFLELLQRVCEATDNWLIQTAACTDSVPSSPSTCSSETSSSTDSSCSSSGGSSSDSSSDSSCGCSNGSSSRPMTVAPLLSCFKNSSVPNLDVSHDAYYTMQDLIDSYRDWVARWNCCLRHFLEWFPFPDATPSAEVVEARSAGPSTTAADATSAPTKVSIQTCTAVVDISVAPQPSCTTVGISGTNDVPFTASSDGVLDNTTENKDEDTGNPKDGTTCAKRSAADFEYDTKDKKMRA